MDLLEHLTKANVGTGDSGNHLQQNATGPYRFYRHISRGIGIANRCAIDPEPIFVYGQRAEALKSKHRIPIS